MTDPDGTAEHDDLLDKVFGAYITIACIVAAVVIAFVAGIAAWFGR